jgi:Arc/MetJ-type ribon-helix-helix transcriptional regulator
MDQGAIVTQVAKRTRLDEPTAGAVVSVVLHLLREAIDADADEVTIPGFRDRAVSRRRHSSGPRHNVTVRLSDAELEALDWAVRASALRSRSEAMRAALDLIVGRAQREALVAAVEAAYGAVEDQPPAWGLEAWQAVGDAAKR